MQNNINNTEKVDKQQSIDNNNTTQVLSTQKLSFSDYLQKPNLINNFNINNIYKISEFLGYPKDQLLWYIYQPLTKSSVGPISSLNLEDMLKDNIINLDSQIRPIDIFANKNTNFSYVKLRDLNDLDDNQNPNISFNFISQINFSNLLQIFFKGKKFYKIKFNLNKENEFESFEIIKKLENANKIECPIDLENKQNLRSYLNKPSPTITKQSEAINNALITSANNLFNKSNKIEKGVNFIRNNKNNNLLTTSAATPVKTEAKVFPLEIERLAPKIQNLPYQESVVKINDSHSVLSSNKSNFFFICFFF